MPLALVPGIRSFRQRRRADQTLEHLQRHVDATKGRGDLHARDLAAHALEEIRRVDFFDAERRSAAEEALAAIERRLQKKPQGGDADAESEAGAAGVAGSA